MPLIRNGKAREAIEALDAADKRVVKRREKAESDQHQKELDEWAKERGLKTTQDHIDYMKRQVFEASKYNPMGSLANEKLFKINTDDKSKTNSESPEAKPEQIKAKPDHPRCTCGAVCIRMYDTSQPISAKIVWLDKVKCIDKSCGKIHKHKLEEVTT